MIQATVHVKLDGLGRFLGEVDNPRGPIRAAFRQWAHRYRTFVQRRFKNYSRGGGDWPPLKRDRAHGRDRRARGRKLAESKESAGASILYDTGTIFRALDPQMGPGGIQEDLPFGVRCGYGGPHAHPKGRATIADIAMFHDQGMGRLPKRQIIVEPDRSTIISMTNDMERALRKLADGV
jgi:hypothetical protein